MKIDTVTYHFDAVCNRADESLTGSAIVLKDGTRINGWFDAKTFSLKRANSVNGRSLRKRDLNSVAGKQLASAFHHYAIANYAVALADFNAATTATEDARLAKVAAEQKAHRDAAVAVVVGLVELDIYERDAGRIVDALIEVGFMSRDERVSL